MKIIECSYIKGKNIPQIEMATRKFNIKMTNNENALL